MANQRIFIRCKSCDDQFFLAKRMMGPFYTSRREMAEDLDTWFAKHTWGLCGNDTDGLDIFEMVYECPQDYEGKVYKIMPEQA